jgi:hypothetical protein
MNSKKPRTPPAKPAGFKAAIGFGPNGPALYPATFPPDKADREVLIATLFVKGIDDWYQDPLKPFSELVRNPEDDLDFTVRIGTGETRQLELTEFAPLRYFQGKYENAPTQFPVGDSARMLLELIYDKSRRQGGLGHLLLIYTTDGAFFVPPPVQELVRRILARDPPRFDRIYFLSPTFGNSATIFTIYPRPPDDWLSDKSDAQLAAIRVSMLDPRALQPLSR